MTNQLANIHGIFPSPVYDVNRDFNLTPKEEKEIEKIIKEGMLKKGGNSTSTNTYIFDENLKELKQFCEQHLNIYVKEVINPKEELDFYITQSWLNITKPGEFHQEHCHSNSMISGVFYISTEESDNIRFTDPNLKREQQLNFEQKEYNAWNSTFWQFPANNNELSLFPSWLGHGVEPNKKATTDRISISFNTFVKGTLGKRKDLTELILK